MPKIEKFSTEILENSGYDFEVEESGVYLIEIIASAKSWWQNLRNLRAFFDDDDLAIKIDGVEFPKLNGKRGLFDSEAAWNGNNLKGLKKTGIFILNIEKGLHKIEFAADKKPIVHNIAINKVDGAQIEYILKENKQAEDGNRRQWITIAMSDLPLQSLEISAKAEKRDKDRDDIKLIIDGEIQKNPDSEYFKNWYWCGTEDNGKEKVFQKEVNLPTGLHYIELWADRMPTLEKIKIVLEENKKETEEVREILEEPEEPQKRIPTVDNPEWTGNFHEDTEQMILARVIFGEARSLPEQGRIAVGWVVKNRIADSRWENNYHDVILEPKQFSAFNEGDKNYNFVKNPFSDSSQIDEWYECYELAGKLLRGELADPTDGANHYFSNFIPAPYWTEWKRAKFKIQIGNTLFYDIRKNNEQGFLKIIVCIETLMLIVIAGMGYLWFLQNNLDYDIREAMENIENNEAPAYKHFFINPQNNKIEAIYFDKEGNTLDTETIIFDTDYRKDQLKSFSAGEMFGYLQELHDKNKTYNLSDFYEKEKFYKDYIALKIVKNEFADPIEVYRGDVHTSSWEWADNNHVIVYYGCGTECLYAYKINIETKKIDSEYHVYGGEISGKERKK